MTFSQHTRFLVALQETVNMNATVAQARFQLSRVRTTLLRKYSARRAIWGVITSDTDDPNLGGEGVIYIQTSILNTPEHPENIYFNNIRLIFCEELPQEIKDKLKI